MKSTDPDDAEKLKNMISECNDKELLKQMVQERKKIKTEFDESNQIQDLISKLLNEQNTLK